jgi:hypothetical protein
MQPVRSARPAGYFGLKNVLIIVDVSLVCIKMCFTCRIRAWTGHGVDAVVS